MQGVGMDLVDSVLRVQGSGFRGWGSGFGVEVFGLSVVFRGGPG